MDTDYQVIWGSPRSCDLESLTINNLGLTCVIQFNDDGSHCRINFKRYKIVLTCDEGVELETTAKIAGTHGQILVLNVSSLRGWMEQESSGVHSIGKNELRHFVVSTNNECISIVAYDEPIVEWIDL